MCGIAQTSHHFARTLMERNDVLVSRLRSLKMRALNLKKLNVCGIRSRNHFLRNLTMAYQSTNPYDVKVL